MHAAALAALLAFAASPAADQGEPAPRELGRVAWRRDLEAALEEARERPAFVLFQEVPGCATCVGFGDGPLSHPLLVEAIETLFVPVLVYNNRPCDAVLLERFDEPSWNNPVVRFLDASGRDVVPRKDRVWDTAGVAARMVAALQARERDVPAWLRLAACESDGAHLEQATFAMHCFWQGEAALGGLDGVVATRPAHQGGREVVEVLFHRPTLGYRELVRAAERRDCAARVLANSREQLEAARGVVGERAVRAEGSARAATPDDHLRALRRSPLRVLPLTPAQATRTNAALASGEDPARWLSPRQCALARRVEQALARDPRALDGLERPASIAALPVYQSELENRLAPR